ncbi:bile acid:sodium symporter family protein [Capnocytophaga catalasegens]|uniref:Bile acid:sodium symporter n=1 Tax=Capnocytophaga catalasegens TaxID=1004260 RepID=A0AAV5AUR0_9FLAO|nr:bile acid:sodium symporter family protein [Capnocytophaga catalasegens]GIZ15035.1 bile acid:sodium symporter [Capnocytophaga catalasegens]GJM49415.1 bile acid:sodium symporter [Capnocytophaga catalasegens]GJM52565.1 bile acid:sodium symporter [Capnocytophaga catalasegens]
MRLFSKIKLDRFVILIILAVILATLFPAQGLWETLLKYLAKIGIALLFFMHGAKLSRQSILSGITNWRMHLLIFCLTFIIFPFLGILLQFIPENILNPTIYSGFLFLCALPSTVQSSIIFTSSARGNVAGAVCSASISSLLGVIVSPFLVGQLLNTHGGAIITIDFLDSVKDIVLQLMLPFFLGHFARPLVGNWIQKHSKLVKFTDQSSILIVVYTAFSKAIIDGLWHRVGSVDLVLISVVSILLLGIVIILSHQFSKLLKFKIEDEIVVVFCGSKKSLVNGVPMANILFPSAMVGVMILPLMIFHQIQLIISAILAQRYAQRKD